MSIGCGCRRFVETSIFAVCFLLWRFLFSPSCRFPLFQSISGQHAWPRRTCRGEGRCCVVSALGVGSRWCFQVADGGAVDAYNKCWAESSGRFECLLKWKDLWSSCLIWGKALRAIGYKRVTWLWKSMACQSLGLNSGILRFQVTSLRADLKM